MASEIRVDKINSLSGVGTVTLSPTGVDIAGITTAATLKVGTGVTASSDGDIFATGVTTSTTFVGALTGNVTGNISGGTVAGSTGTFTGDVDIASSLVHTGDTDTKLQFTTDNIALITGGTTRVNITSGGNLEMPNDNDYIKIGAGQDLQLVHTGSSSNIVNTTGALQIQSDLIRFDNASGTERARIDSSGRFGIGTNNPDSLLHVYGATTGYAKIETGDGSTNPIIMHKNPDRTWHAGLRGDASDGYVIRDATASSNRLTIDTSGNVTVGSGNIVIGTSGKGIDFSSASPSASNPSHNILDDYEEGTWTLGVAHDAITSEYGRYTKIGRMVYATFEITFGSSSNGGHQYITGLPFTSQASSDNGGNCGGVARDYQNYDIENGPIYHIQQNGTVVYFYKNNGQVMAASNTSGYNFRGTAIYHAA